MTDYDSDPQDSTGYRDAKTLRSLYCDERMSISEIADSFGVADSTIQRWLHRNDIETRRRGGKRKERAQYGIDGHGYERWKDRDGGNHTVVRVHQLLAIADGESPSDVFGGGATIHHRNEVPWDNRPENIVLLDPAEHIRKHEPNWEPIGNKLSPDDVREIRELTQTDLSQRDIADRFGVTQSMVSNIKTGEQWSSVE